MHLGVSRQHKEQKQFPIWKIVESNSNANVILHTLSFQCQELRGVLPHYESKKSFMETLHSEVEVQPGSQVRTGVLWVWFCLFSVFGCLSFHLCVCLFVCFLPYQQAKFSHKSAVKYE